MRGTAGDYERERSLRQCTRELEEQGAAVPRHAEDNRRCQCFVPLGRRIFYRRGRRAGGVGPRLARAVGWRRRAQPGAGDRQAMEILAMHSRRAKRPARDARPAHDLLSKCTVDAVTPHNMQGRCMMDARNARALHGDRPFRTVRAKSRSSCRANAEDFELDPRRRVRLHKAHENVRLNRETPLIMHDCCRIPFKMHGHGGFPMQQTCKTSSRRIISCSACDSPAL